VIVPAVLGIDAAWTSGNPSGVALIEKSTTAGQWTCISAAPSLALFSSAVGLPLPPTPTLQSLLSNAVTASGMLTRQPLRIIAIDLPLSYVPITGRRPCDDSVSRRFGRNGCSSHTPSSLRPGVISGVYLNTFSAAGFQLATLQKRWATAELIEVYPHPAILTLLKSHFRLPYKVTRTVKYWPALRWSRVARFRLVHGALSLLLQGLTRQIQGINISLPPLSGPVNFTALKPFEDTLDALVCAWAGAEHLAGRTLAFGDADATIWVP
jgi:predicted RNase H-like nuclease